MSDLLTLGLVDYRKTRVLEVDKECSCEGIKKGLAPSFVFSEEGETGFQNALYHLSLCRKSNCLKFRKIVFSGIKNKLDWLVKENVLLGCHFIRPYLYEGKRSLMLKKDICVVFRHLSSCDTESCGKLRRSVLLTIRDEINVF